MLEPCALYHIGQSEKTHKKTKKNKTMMHSDFKKLYSKNNIFVARVSSHQYVA